MKAYPLRRLLIVLILIGVLVGCTERGLTPDDLPTPITDLNDLATAQAATQNAPPVAFRDSISFPQLDAGLNDLDNWHYEVTLDFDGVFSDTPRPVRARTTAEVWYSKLGTERRVVLNADGELLVDGEAQKLEGVRVGSETFLVQDGTCVETTGTQAEPLADLGVGALIGGVRTAYPDGSPPQIINGEEVWRYAFLPNDLNIDPSIRTGENGVITFLNGELWFSPEHRAVVRFYVTLDVQRAQVFNSQLPVTGEVIMRYDLTDIGIDPNITIPFGC